jgi:hypothetical protein
VRRILFTLPVALVVSGCFRYVPADVQTTPPGDGVRLLLTRQGTVELASVTEEVEGAVSTLDGEVVRTEGPDLLLQVPVGERQVGFMPTELNQTIRVPLSEILSFERRELDRGATALFVGGTLGLAGIVIYYIMDARQGDGDGPTVDPPELRKSLALLSIPIGR